MKHFKVILLTLVFTTIVFSNDEIKRVDQMVADIVKLRQNYEQQLTNERSKNEKYKKKISSLENQIKELKNLSKNKEISIKKRAKELHIAPKCEENNSFPKLKMRVQYFPASSFRLVNDAEIYADKDSDEIVERWEKGTSFTSNIKSDKRIKITGYFVNRVWQKATRDMWVDSSNVKQRD